MDEKTINCPCCGYRTIDDSFIPIDEICEVCYWQYDEMANRNPERVVGPNSISLNEARENYKQFGACEERFATNSQLSSDDEKINQELSNYNWMDIVADKVEKV